ncbi:hypothetical protein Peur_002373 [Populus x canadensis]
MFGMGDYIKDFRRFHGLMIETGFHAEVTNKGLAHLVEAKDSNDSTDETGKNSVIGFQQTIHPQEVHSAEKSWKNQLPGRIAVFSGNELLEIGELNVEVKILKKETECLERKRGSESRQKGRELDAWAN